MEYSKLLVNLQQNKLRMEQNNLFKFTPLRTRNGRYCTKEQLRIERVDNENKRLLYERDKYYRAWLSVSSKASRLERELQELKSKIGGLI